MYNPNQIMYLIRLSINVSGLGSQPKKSVPVQQPYAKYDKTSSHNG